MLVGVTDERYGGTRDSISPKPGSIHAHFLSAGNDDTTPVHLASQDHMPENNNCTIKKKKQD